MEIIVPALCDFVRVFANGFRGGGGACIACIDLYFGFFPAPSDRERGNGGAFFRSFGLPVGPLGGTPDVQMGGGMGLKCF